MAHCILVILHSSFFDWQAPVTTRACKAAFHFCAHPHAGEHHEAERTVATVHVLAQSAPLRRAEGGLTSWILDPWILPTPFTSSTSPSGDLRMQDAETIGRTKRKAKIVKGFQALVAKMKLLCRDHALEDTLYSLRAWAPLRQDEATRQWLQVQGGNDKSPAGWVGEVQDGSLQHSLSVRALL